MVQQLFTSWGERDLLNISIVLMENQWRWANVHLMFDWTRLTLMELHGLINTVIQNLMDITILLVWILLQLSRVMAKLTKLNHLSFMYMLTMEAMLNWELEHVQGFKPIKNFLQQDKKFIIQASHQELVVTICTLPRAFDLWAIIFINLGR